MFDHIYAIWEDHHLSWPSVYLRYDNPDDASFRSGYDPRANRLVFLPLSVSPEYRGRGLATRLVSALAHVAITHQVDTIGGAVESEYTLKIIRKLFDEKRISFYDFDPMTADEAALPLSMQQAIASLVRAAGYEADLEHRKYGFSVDIDMAGSRAVAFEAPIVLVPPPKNLRSNH